MTTVDERERRFLDRVQRASSLAPARSRQIFANVQSALVTGHMPTVTKDELPDPSKLASNVGSAATKGWTIKLLGVGLLTGGALGFLGGYMVFGGGTHDVVRAQEAPLPSTELPIEQATIQSVPAVLDTNTAHDETPLRASRPSLPPQRKASKQASNEELPKLSFHEEISYLRRAQAALHERDPNLAWGLMTSLDEQQPTGALIPERVVTKVIALCALERVTEAQQQARWLLERKPDSVYAERLEKSCAALSISSNSNTNQQNSPSENTQRMSH